MNHNSIKADEVEDLRWYFQDSLGDAGAKSPLGYQLDMLRAGILNEHSCKQRLPRAELCLVVAEAVDGDVDLADVLLSGLANERIQMAAARANKVGRRLKRVDRDYRLVLELHYSEVAKYKSIGLDLLCISGQAVALYRKSLEKVTKKTKAHCMSLREWVQWLIARAEQSAASKACLTLMHKEAQQLLDKAHEAYAGTRD